MTENAILIGIVSTLTGLLVKVVDLGYQYIKNKTVGDKTQDSLDELVTAIRSLTVLLNKSGPDNSPLIYNSTQLANQVNENHHILTGLSYHSELVSKSLDKIAEALSGVSRVLDRLEDRVKK